MMLTRYDEEIREVEARLSFERVALAHGAEDFAHAAKCKAVSPKGLGIAAAVGFLLGELTRPRHGRAKQAAQSSVAPSAVGLGGLLGGLALALIRAQFGSPLGMGKAAIEYASARSRARAAARTRAGADPASPGGASIRAPQ
jgi:hypothetical protein